MKKYLVKDVGPQLVMIEIKGIEIYKDYVFKQSKKKIYYLAKVKLTKKGFVLPGQKSEYERDPNSNSLRKKQTQKPLLSFSELLKEYYEPTAYEEILVSHTGKLPKFIIEFDNEKDAALYASVTDDFTGYYDD